MIPNTIINLTFKSSVYIQCGSNSPWPKLMGQLGCFNVFWTKGYPCFSKVCLFSVQKIPSCYLLMKGKINVWVCFWESWQFCTRLPCLLPWTFASHLQNFGKKGIVCCQLLLTVCSFCYYFYCLLTVNFVIGDILFFQNNHSHWRTWTNSIYLLW